MTTDEHRLSRKTLNVIAASVIVSAVLLGLLYTVGTHRCLEKTLGFGQETMVFLENACEKYDRYEQGGKPRRRTICSPRSNRLRRSCPLIALRLTTILSSNLSMPRTFRG